MTAEVAIDYDQVAGKLKVIADATRLRIMARLCEGKGNVLTLASEIGSPSQPATSYHLRSLRLSGLIQYRKDGKDNIYSITEQGRRLLAAAQSLAG